MKSPHPAKSVFKTFVVLSVIGSSLAFQQTPRVNVDDPSTREDFQAGDVDREPYQRASDLLAALEASRGDWVADVGAGAGYYSMRLSSVVGPEGKVFGEDISNTSLRWLDARVKAFNLSNVEVIKGDADDTKLPLNHLTCVLIVDAYHHFTNHEAMLSSIRAALKPGGRLVIADYSFKEHRTQPRADQLRVHEIDPALVRMELADAGFQVVRVEDPFVKWTPGVAKARSSPTELWLMVATRPD